MVRLPPSSSLPRRAEEVARLLHGARVDAARHDLPRATLLAVVGARQPRERVEENHDVAPVLHLTPRVLEDDLGDVDVLVGHLVGGGGDDLALDRTTKVGDLLGPLVDEEHDELGLRMVGRDAGGHLLEEGGLAGLRSGNDQPALAETDGADEVQHAHRYLGRLGLQTQPAVRRDGSEMLEGDVVPPYGHSVDGGDLLDHRMSLGATGRLDDAAQKTAGAEDRVTDGIGGDEDVAGRREVAVFLAPQEPVSRGHHLEQPFGGLAGRRTRHALSELRVLGRSRAAAAHATALTAATPAPTSSLRAPATTNTTVLRRGIRGILALGVVRGVVPRRPAVLARTSLRAVSHKISTKPLLAGPPIFVPVIILRGGRRSLLTRRVPSIRAPAHVHCVGSTPGLLTSHRIDPGGARDPLQLSRPLATSCRQPARTPQSSTVLPRR